MDVKKAVVLLSGGLDSATVLAMAQAEGFECHALTFHYGQRNHHEVEAASQVSRTLGAQDHKRVELDVRAILRSGLSDGEVPKDRTDEEMVAAGVPVTYVPCRNAVFLSIAFGWAESLGASHVFLGANISGYPDCWPQFFEAFERAMAIGMKAGLEGKPVRIRTPIMGMTKAEVIRKGVELRVPYKLTLTCYDPVRYMAPDPKRGGFCILEQWRACGRCDSCTFRRRGFEEAGVQDPTSYA